MSILSRAKRWLAIAAFVIGWVALCCGSEPTFVKSLEDEDINAQSARLTNFIGDYYAGRSDAASATRIHALATHILEDSNAVGGNLESAAYVIGLTGNERDLTLLQRRYNHSGYGGYWGLKLRAAMEAAMARLGSRTAFESIKKALSRRVPRSPNLRTGESIENSLRAAGFVGSEEFIPLLCRHLKDPNASDGRDDFILLQQSAEAALSAIVDKTSPFDIIGRGTKWKSACQ